MSSDFRQLSAASAHHLSRNITELSNTFIPGRQEDSEEFLNCLLNHLVKCLTPINTPPTLSRPKTSIDNLFQFQMKSCVECSKCKYMSNNIEPYFVWSVPINGHTSLLNALDAFCRPECLSGENAYSCTYCSKYVQALKRLSIVDVSPYIIISLKRFRSGQYNTQKLTHLVTYPEILDISSYFSGDYQKIPGSNNENYHLNFRLYCVIVHLGSEVQNGHLFAYI
jgi:ubiquitin C-terminal hydrolase